ncbi:hypothetical protein MNBD_GAMMA02-1702 [hydrothermal vent metagenome]|uniref:HD domain-containing protein n=1 Tax=hydrothermal vent metagenome TaxID=652676 RepID=A0A3B0WBL4_9ZZZZ
MRYKLGTKKWVEKYNGKLGFRDKMSMIYQGVKARSKTIKQIKNGDKLANLSIDEILPPDSAICQEAMLLCEEVSQPFLFNHSMRSYFWARLLNTDKSFDDEAAFVAMLLHDLGLTNKYKLGNGSQQCFTLPAANIAEEMALKHNWSSKRALIVANAITLHLNVTIDACHGVEAILVRKGSGADVAGLGLHLLHREQISGVVEKFPRLDLKKEMQIALNNEINNRSCCRISYLYQKLQFGEYIRKAPFEE